MKPQHYVDFQIALPEREPDTPSPKYEHVQGSGTTLPAPVIAGAMLKVLHGLFGQQPGRYALALPKHQSAPFAALRVFAENRDDLDELVQAVEGHPVIRDYSRIGYPRKIPKDHDGPWVEFRRYRIPSRKAGRKPGDILRERRMMQAEERRLPYFILNSLSTGQQFGLYVEVLHYATPNANPVESTPHRGEMEGDVDELSKTVPSPHGGGLGRERVKSGASPSVERTNPRTPCPTLFIPSGDGVNSTAIPDCQPDSYGLSVSSRPFALPDLP